MSYKKILKSSEMREIVLDNKLTFDEVYYIILKKARKGYMYWVFEQEIENDALKELELLGYNIQYPYDSNRRIYVTTITCTN